MFPGDSSYGMEADPPRFLYLKDEYFLMTDWCDLDISLIMKNSLSLWPWPQAQWESGGGVGGGQGEPGMEQRKILDQYLTSGIVSTRSIQRFKRFLIFKTFNQTVRDLDIKVSEGGGMVQH